MSPGLKVSQWIGPLLDLHEKIREGALPPTLPTAAHASPSACYVGHVCAGHGAAVRLELAKDLNEGDYAHVQVRRVLLLPACFRRRRYRGRCPRLPRVGRLRVGAASPGWRRDWSAPSCARCWRGCGRSAAAAQVVLHYREPTTGAIVARVVTRRLRVVGTVAALLAAVDPTAISVVRA